MSLGQTPIVIDSDDILANPRAALSELCAGLGIRFDSAMLSWMAGPRAEDGVWASHWYDAVHQSTGFGAVAGPIPVVAPEFSEILDQSKEIYHKFEVIKQRV